MYKHLQSIVGRIYCTGELSGVEAWRSDGWWKYSQRRQWISM